jgi:hypothetical protein
MVINPEWHLIRLARKINYWLWESDVLIFYFFLKRKKWEGAREKKEVKERTTEERKKENGEHNGILLN